MLKQRGTQLEVLKSKVEIPRIRVGKRQTIDSLICEEALLFAKYLRGERDSWILRLPTLESYGGKCY